jgi:protein-disulfide isomerase/uncharacterized membrane protein
MTTNQPPATLTSFLKFFMVLLALLGLADTIVITAVMNLGPGYCIGGGSCDKVLTSSYSKLAGLPLSTWGGAFYSLLLVNALIYAFGSYRSALRFNLILTAIGTLFSGYLVYLQGWVIGVWCIYCLTSALTQVLLLLVSIALVRIDRVSTQPSRSQFRSYVGAYGLMALVMLGLGVGQNLLWKAIKAAQKPNDPLIASIAGKEYRLSELIELRRSGYESDKRVFEGYRTWYRNELLAREAKALGFDGQPSFLIDSEYNKARRQFTDADIDAYYRAQHSSTDGAGVPTRDERESIRRDLESQDYDRFKIEFMSGLEQKYAARFLGTPPPPPYVDFSFNPSDVPILGNPSSQTKIVEFADLTCSHCRELAPQLRNMYEADPERIAIAYRHYFLGGEASAATIAARAATAAFKQGKFWEYVEQLFEAQGRGITEGTYVEIARNVGLDITRFEEDRRGSEVAELIQRDLEEAKRLGVTRTPTVYINGVLLEKEVSLATIEEGIRQGAGGQGPKAQ